MIKRLWLFSILLLLYACASPPDVPQLEDSGSSLPKLNVSENNFSPYFGSIENEVLLKIQNGTPSSIREAMATLRDDYDDSYEQVQVLLSICTVIMDYAWPSETYIPVPPSVLPTNVYTSTLASIQRGIYELSFDSADFFSLTLPSLVLFSNSNGGAYFSDAKIALEKSLEMENNSVLTLYLLANLEMRMENFSNAQLYFEKAMSLDSQNMDIIYAYLKLLLASGKAEQAYSFGQNAMSNYPSNVTLLEYSARAAYGIEDFLAAESLVAQALRFTPDNTSLLLFRAKVLFELGDYLDVSSLLDVYSRTRSQDKDYLLLRAKLQSTWNKNTPAATRTIQEALSLYPDDVEILLFAANLASINAQQIQGRSAMDFIASILEKEPDNFQALGILVRESIAEQNWEEAYEASTYVVSNITPNLETALLHVEICIALGYLQEARNIIDIHYTSDATNENLLQWYIRLLIAEGNYTQAENLIESTLQSASGSMKSILHYERSRLQDSDARILSDLRASLTANPRNVDALFGLYVYYYERQDYSKAQYYLKQVIALNPSNSDAILRNAELDSLLQ